MRTDRLAATIASLFLLSTPAIATAAPADVTYPRAAAPTMGTTASDYAPKIGDTPADFAQPVAPAAKVGDTPVDHPVASRAPAFEPPAIEIVRPERTIVRDVNDELPLILAGLALLVAIGGAGFALVRTRRIALSR